MRAPEFPAVEERLLTIEKVASALEFLAFAAAGQDLDRNVLLGVGEMCGQIALTARSVLVALPVEVLGTEVPMLDATWLEPRKDPPRVASARQPRRQPSA